MLYKSVRIVNSSLVRLVPVLTATDSAGQVRQKFNPSILGITMFNDAIPCVPPNSSCPFQGINFCSASFIPQSVQANVVRQVGKIFAESLVKITVCAVSRRVLFVPLLFAGVSAVISPCKAMEIACLMFAVVGSGYWRQVASFVAFVMRS